MQLPRTSPNDRDTSHPKDLTGLYMYQYDIYAPPPLYIYAPPLYIYAPHGLFTLNVHVELTAHIFSYYISTQVCE